MSASAETRVAATDWKLNGEIRSGINQIFDEVGVPTYQNIPRSSTSPAPPAAAQRA